jgi:copper transport protein
MLVLGRAGEGAAARSAALAFGELAVVSVALLAITGIGVLGIHVRTGHDLVATGYGRTLLVKTGLFVLAGAVGLSTALGLRTPGAPFRPWLPRLESVVLVALLVPAALLTAQAPARGDTLAPSPAASRPVTSFANVHDLVVSVAVEPNRPGPNFVTVRVYNTRRPAPAPIAGVSLTLDGLPRALTHAQGTEWRTVTTLHGGGARAAVVVRRPQLPATTATTSWRVVRPASLPPRAAPRMLEPTLKPVAIGGAVVFLAFLLVRLARVLRRPVVSGGLRPGKVEP